MRLFILLLCFLSYPTMADLVIQPKFKRVKLKEFTSMQLYVMPDTGTQLIFPFLLNNPSLKPKLKIKLTNADGFSVPTTEQEMKALIEQNTITIIGKNGNDMPKYLGNLFISVGGYNLSIGLSTVYDVRKTVSNIIFDISEKERKHLIDRTVQLHKDKLNLEFDNLKKGLNKRAREIALSLVTDLVLEKDTSSANFKADGDLIINGERLVVYLDKVITQSSFATILFDIDNKSKLDTKIKGMRVYKISKDGEEQEVVGATNCPDRLEGSGSLTCGFTTLDKSVIDAYKFKISISNDQGIGEVIL